MSFAKWDSDFALDASRTGHAFSSGLGTPLQTARRLTQLRNECTRKARDLKQKRPAPKPATPALASQAKPAATPLTAPVAAPATAPPGVPVPRPLEPVLSDSVILRAAPAPAVPAPAPPAPAAAAPTTATAQAAVDASSDGLFSGQLIVPPLPDDGVRWRAIGSVILCRIPS